MIRVLVSPTNSQGAMLSLNFVSLSRSLDEGSFKAGAAGRQRRKAWDGEVDAEVKKHIECCLRGFSKSEKEVGFGTWSDTTPEAVFAMPSKFTVKGCPKKCMNVRKSVLEDQAWEWFGPLLHQLTGECPFTDQLFTKLSFEGWAVVTDSVVFKYFDEVHNNSQYLFSPSKASFQIANYCFEKYSDKYVPAKRVVNDQFEQVNKYVVDALKGAGIPIRIL